jgi:hypothetical protein
VGKGWRRDKEARWEGEAGDDTQAGKELFRNSREKGEGDPLANQHGAVDFGPSRGIAYDLADDALKEGGARWTEATPEVEREG